MCIIKYLEELSIVSVDCRSSCYLEYGCTKTQRRKKVNIYMSLLFRS